MSINVTAQNIGTMAAMIEIGLLKSYDLLGRKGREEHENRMVALRRNGISLKSIEWEEQNSKVIPYNI